MSEAIEYNGEVPDFYVSYDLKTNAICDNIESCVCFTGEDGNDKYMAVDISLTENEKDLLKNVLNEYCVEEYQVDLDFIAKQEYAQEENSSHDEEER